MDKENMIIKDKKTKEEIMGAMDRQDKGKDKQNQTATIFQKEPNPDREQENKIQKI